MVEAESKNKKMKQQSKKRKKKQLLYHSVSNAEWRRKTTQREREIDIQKAHFFLTHKQKWAVENRAKRSN